MRGQGGRRRVGRKLGGGSWRGTRSVLCMQAGSVYVGLTPVFSRSCARSLTNSLDELRTNSLLRRPTSLHHPPPLVPASPTILPSSTATLVQAIPPTKKNNLTFHSIRVPPLQPFLLPLSQWLPLRFSLAQENRLPTRSVHSTTARRKSTNHRL